MEKFLNIDGVYYQYHGEWSDPDIFYNGYVFNYLDVIDGLHDEYVEEAEGKDVEYFFSTFLQDNLVSYLDEIIMGGYFKDGSTSWHDN